MAGRDSEYRRVYDKRQEAKQPQNDESQPKSTSPSWVEPLPIPNNKSILDEGGVPRYQLPTEKTRMQMKSQTEKA